MKSKKVVFILNLLQDINILRPLIYIASADLQASTEIIMTSHFCKRDTEGTWRDEVNEIVKETISLLFSVEDAFEASKVLQGKSGVLIAASESNLAPHAPTHNIFKIASRDFLTVTLQHGFECVGFLQSRQHVIAYGTNVTFAADVICGWSVAKNLTNIAPSQHSKLLVTGPTSVIQPPTKQIKKKYGIICENLHSVRLSASGDLKFGFMEMFDRYCQHLSIRGKNVALRPHPGGQYVIKNKIKLAGNVLINNNPMYKVDLSQYAYGVSAPSSVLIDMILAEIPVAVWRDVDGIMDVDNYFGLAQVSTIDDLIEFEKDAIRTPQKYLARQRDFIKRSGLQVDAEAVYKQYRTLMDAGINSSYPRQEESGLVVPSGSERIFFIANDFIPTLQLSFMKPLANMIDSEKVSIEVMTEKDIREAFPNAQDSSMACQLLQTKLDEFKPTVILFCRYSGPNSVFIRLWAKQNNVPVIFHIDDDLLHVPMTLGLAKFKTHNSPKRIKAVRYLLDNSDLIYCSTKPLSKRFESLLVTTPIHVGGFYCSGSIIAPAENREIKKIGYMGFDHAHDLNTVISAIEHIMAKNPSIVFEMFGTIPKPSSLDKFGSRVVMREPVRDYKLFLETFASLNWDIGICPLAVEDFNLLKANTKWVEYSSIGAAVVATRHTVYDDCVADDCGILASSIDEWVDALDKLVNNPEYRYTLVRNAQKKLDSSFNLKQLEEQVLEVFNKAKNLINV